MPRCHNVPDSHPPVYYSGKENTPRRFGYCAGHEKEGQLRKGKNGVMYQVKNNKWVKAKTTGRKSPSRKGMSPTRKTSPRLSFGVGVGVGMGRTTRRRKSPKRKTSPTRKGKK